MIELKPENRPVNPFSKIHLIQIRLNQEEFGILKQKAALYAGANMSRWLRAAIRNYKPRKNDLKSVD